MVAKGWGNPSNKKSDRQSKGGRAHAKKSKESPNASEGTPHSRNIRFSQTECTPQSNAEDDLRRSGRLQEEQPSAPAKRKRPGGRRTDTEAQKQHKQRMRSSTAAAKSRAEEARLRDEIHQLERDVAELGNDQGRPSSYDRNICILQYMLNKRLQNRKSDKPRLSNTAIWTKAARIFKITRSGLDRVSTQSILHIWDAERAILVNDEKVMSNREYSDARQLGPADLSFIDDHISDLHKRGGSVTINSIRAALARPLVPAGDAKPGRGLSVKRNVVEYALRKFLGYEWGRVKGKKIQRNEARQSIIRAYLADLADAYKLEADGDHVIVYTDESYIHQNIAPEFSWIKEGNDVERSRSKGQRICILHAITKHGPLTYKQGEYPESIYFTGDKKKTLRQVDHKVDGRHTCEYLFVGKKNTGDYHDMMNNKNFMEWVDEKLIPTFKARFPSKKMILVLDNAPYHHCIEYELPTKKGDIVDYLREHGCEELKVHRADGSSMRFNVDDDRLKGRNKEHTCNLEELRPAALRWFQMNKKEMLESDLVRKFRKEEWHVLFTPPYCPDLQPIELFWAAGKNWARYLNTEHRRSIEKCIEDLRAGWYGGGAKEPADCAKLVLHSLKKANERISKDEDGILVGRIETGLTVKDGCDFCIGFDEIGRATKLMMRSSTSPDDTSNNDAGLIGADNTVGDGVDDDDDDLAADREVESPAAAAVSADATLQPRGTVVQQSTPAGSHFSSGMGRIAYRPAYHPMFGSHQEFENQLSVLEGGIRNLRSSLQGDYVMSGFQALCPIAFSDACGNSLNLI